MNSDGPWGLSRPKGTAYVYTRIFKSTTILEDTFQLKMGHISSHMGLLYFVVDLLEGKCSLKLEKLLLSRSLLISGTCVSL